jgi:hypothetical protein
MKARAASSLSQTLRAKDRTSASRASLALSSGDKVGNSTFCAASFFRWAKVA